MTGWDVSQTLKVIEPVYKLLKGVPTESTLASAYWRKKTAVPAAVDPDRDGCGLLWCSPVVPNAGADARSVTDLATRVVLETDSSRRCQCRWPRSEALVRHHDQLRPHGRGEDERAFACYEAVAVAPRTRVSAVPSQRRLDGAAQRSVRTRGRTPIDQSGPRSERDSCARPVRARTSANGRPHARRRLTPGPAATPRPASIIRP